MHNGKLRIIKNRFKIIEVTANLISFLSLFLSCKFVNLRILSLDLNIVTIINNENMSISANGTIAKLIKSIRSIIHLTELSKSHLTSSLNNAEPSSWLVVKFKDNGFNESKLRMGE